MERAHRSRADRCLPTAPTSRQSHQPACGMLLDSDVLIEVLRGNAQTARWVAAEVSTGEALRYSPVSRAEIGAGMRAGEEMGIAALFAGLDAMTIDATTGELAGERLRRYRRSHALELGDALIGASAAQYGERLATFNRRHYPGIAQLSSPDR
ncbi:MAG: type II toxin-antitoxin system VapC family toxin [Chloroflexi bacterium]|nr:MAG: type II toxin-antitoxin system VapC family toxin [Chloroflexota bacterium]